MSLLLFSFGVLAAGAVLALLSAAKPLWSLWIGMGAIALAMLMCAGASVWVLISGDIPAHAVSWMLPIGRATLALDALSAWFVLTIALLGIASAVYSCGYMPREQSHGSLAGFAALLCVLIGAMVLAVCAADVVLFLVAWEMMTLAAFFLVSFDDRKPEVRRGAWMYLIATHLGTAIFLLPMFAMLVAKHGTDYGAISIGLRSASPGFAGLLFVLGLIGFGTKAGVMPMHVWLPSAHPVAPTPVSALLSGVVVKIWIYGLFRLLTWLPPLPSGYAAAMLIVGIVSGICGVLYALAQHDIKRLLAYHTVENIGIIALGIGMGMLGQSTGHPGLATIGYCGALLHVLNHAAFKGLLFFSAGAVIQSTGTGDIDRLGGLAKRTPINAFLFLLAAVAICGLPPLNGFVSEWLIYGSMFGGIAGAGWTRAAFIVASITALGLMGGLALACFAKVFGVVFLGTPRHELAEIRPTPRLMLAGMMAPAALCVGIGVLPGVAVRFELLAAAQMTHQSAASLVSAVRRTLAPLMVLTLFALLLGAMIVVLTWLRARLADRAKAPAISRAPTWGCGYAFPTPRMQYTSSSFAWPLVATFRHVLSSERHMTVPGGVFPRAGALHTHTDDVAEMDAFAPLFRGVSRLTLMIKTVSWSGRPIAAPVVAPTTRRGPIRVAIESIVAGIRRGNIQMRLTYIVVALVLVFVIEALRWPAAHRGQPAPAPTESQRTGP